MLRGLPYERVARASVLRPAIPNQSFEMGIVEALERAGPLGEVREADEALLAEEALVEGVVEVLDRAVAPRLPGRDEHLVWPLRVPLLQTEHQFQTEENSYAL